jgi:putative flippase GtrA
MRSRRKDEANNLSVWKRLFHTFLETSVSILGGLLVLVCCYWFFHYETWHERLIAIGVSILVVYIVVKILPDRPDQ